MQLYRVKYIQFFRTRKYSLEQKCVKFVYIVIVPGKCHILFELS